MDFSFERLKALESVSWARVIGYPVTAVTRLERQMIMKKATKVLNTLAPRMEVPLSYGLVLILSSESIYNFFQLSGNFFCDLSKSFVFDHL